MKKIVIAGSAKLHEKVSEWVKFFEIRNYEILDYPKIIEKERFMELYPMVHKSFFESVTKADVLFIMNEDKNGISGYIGAEAFAELTFGLAQKLVYNKEIELVILKMPGEGVQCYDEINLWLKLGWVRLYSNKEIVS